MLDYLESQIPMGRFIFGDFMMADLSIASPFINAISKLSETEHMPKMERLIEWLPETHSATAWKALLFTRRFIASTM